MNLYFFFATQYSLYTIISIFLIFSRLDTYPDGPLSESTVRSGSQEGYWLMKTWWHIQYDMRAPCSCPGT